MSKIGIFMADGSEEIEGLTVVDIARRAGIEIETISIMDTNRVTGSHEISFETDTTKDKADYDSYDAIVLPGGMPGTIRLGEDETVNRVILEFAEKGRLVAAICAAPGVLGKAGLLKGKNATCHPGHEGDLIGANVLEDMVVEDGNIITSRGMGTSIPFALAIVRYLADEAVADKVKKALVYV